MIIDNVDIIGVPLDLGVTELGLKLGPEAFRNVGLMNVASRLGLSVRDRGNITVPTLTSTEEDRDDNIALIATYCTAIAEKVEESLVEGRVPVCIGGDHSLAIGSLAGVCRKYGRVGCLWLDAHPDANTPETSPSGNIHGMPLAIVLGHGPTPLVGVNPRQRSVIYEDLSLVGVRDIDPGEEKFLRQNEIQTFSVYDVLEQGLRSVLDQSLDRVTANTEGVHVSLDLDVLHEDVAPGVGLLSHCGFDIREITYICQRIADRCHVTSVDIVGLNPVRDINAKTARLALELLMILLGHPFSFSYQTYLREQAQ